MKSKKISEENKKIFWPDNKITTYTNLQDSAIEVFRVKLMVFNVYIGSEEGLKSIILSLYLKKLKK